MGERSRLYTKASECTREVCGRACSINRSFYAFFGHPRWGEGVHTLFSPRVLPPFLRPRLRRSPYCSSRDSYKVVRCGIVRLAVHSRARRASRAFLFHLCPISYRHVRSGWPIGPAWVNKPPSCKGRPGLGPGGRPQDRVMFSNDTTATKETHAPHSIIHSHMRMPVLAESPLFLSPTHSHRQIPHHACT